MNAHWVAEPVGINGEIWAATVEPHSDWIRVWFQHPRYHLWESYGVTRFGVLHPELKEGLGYYLPRPLVW